MKLLDQVVLVVGASRGLGRAMALRFGAEGAQVICAARTKSDIDSLVEEIHCRGGQATAILCDTADEKQIKNMIAQTIGKFGRIDVLVHNAAIGEKIIGGGPKPLYTLTKEEWDKIINVNLTGAFLCIRYVLDFMIPRRQGNIINISSGRGWSPRQGIGAYVCSKHGMEGLTKQFALELKEFGINVNSLIPGGGVFTGFHAWMSEEQRQKKHWLPVEVMNDAAVFLASQSPHGISGNTIVATEFNEQEFTSAKDVEEWVKSLRPERLLKLDE